MVGVLRNEGLFKYRETLVGEAFDTAFTRQQPQVAESTLMRPNYPGCLGSFNPGFGSLLSGNVHGSTLDQSHA